MGMARSSWKGCPLPIVGLVLVFTIWSILGCAGRPGGVPGSSSSDAEAEYIAVFDRHLASLSRHIRALYRSDGAPPGVCNKGGDAQACLDADLVILDDLVAMTEALASVEVPPRFAEADRIVRDAIRLNMQGLELRARALQGGDDSAWIEHGLVLEESRIEWLAAYAAFPSDHRPGVAP
jgi:hypothetical protein